MTNRTNQLRIPLECYKNGELTITTSEKAAEEVSRANYSLIAPLDKYVWNIDGFAGQNNIYPIAGEKPSMLGLLIHTNHGQPFTVDEAEALINNKKELDHWTFVAWACRFNRIFRKPYVRNELPKELWPFRYLKVATNSGNIMRPAYQMHPSRTYFVVLGVDHDSVDEDIIVQWPLLLKRFNQRVVT
jgi:hypothetical protein